MQRMSVGSNDVVIIIPSNSRVIALGRSRHISSTYVVSRGGVKNLRLYLSSKRWTDTGHRNSEL